MHRISPRTQVNGTLIHEAIAKKDGVVLYLSGTLFVPKGVDLVAY